MKFSSGQSLQVFSIRRRRPDGVNGPAAQAAACLRAAQTKRSPIMTHQLCVATCLLVVSSGLLHAGDNSQVPALKAQIQQLKEQEKTQVKQIDDKYRSIEENFHANDRSIRAERDKLSQQRSSELKNVPTSAHDQIHAKFDSKIKELDEKIKQGQHGAHEAKLQRESEAKTTKAQFHAKIEALEKQLHELEHQAKQKPTTKSTNKSTSNKSTPKQNPESKKSK